MKILIAQILLFTTVSFCMSFQDIPAITGHTFYGYTRHPQCEIMTTELLLNADSSFHYITYCSDKIASKELRFEKKGRWQTINDSTLHLLINDTLSWPLHIISERQVELIRGKSFYSFKLSRE